MIDIPLGTVGCTTVQGGGVRNGIFWGTWPGISEAQPSGYKSSFKEAKMMIRPKNFKP
ncbi:fibroleukin-like protein [Leptotrombidium deliense]|uniref:Fibroleukin-like protein n=1 Tax=Leptotrombidium deliense TaxID=299467 RepID=A0A443Q9S3_9ACAR|nr:fibroleukin-like protein [Leptotrombidium deliense]